MVATPVSPELSAPEDELAAVAPDEPPPPLPALEAEVLEEASPPEAEVAEPEPPSPAPMPPAPEEEVAEPASSSPPAPEEVEPPPPEPPPPWHDPTSLGTPTHTPAWHASASVQVSPSSQRGPVVGPQAPC